MAQRVALNRLPWRTLSVQRHCGAHFCDVAVAIAALVHLSANSPHESSTGGCNNGGRLSIVEAATPEAEKMFFQHKAFLKEIRISNKQQTCLSWINVLRLHYVPHLWLSVRASSRGGAKQTPLVRVYCRSQRRK